MHSILISFSFSFILGIVHKAFSPVTKKISNLKLTCNVYSERSSPFIINVPVSSESVVSIDVALNIGIYSFLNSSDV